MEIDRRSAVFGAAALGLGWPARAVALQSGSEGLQRPPPHTRVERLAWAGLRLERGDVALFIDAVAPDPTRGTPGPHLETRARRNFALVTHHHGDHFDPKALQPVLGERGYVVAHEETVRLLDTRQLKVQPARFYEPIFLSRAGGEFVAFAVPAGDGLGSPQVSWVIDDGEHRFIHCGDTAWHGGWWDIARAYGPFDFAFLPINGLRQTQGRFDKVPEPMSLTPEQAVEAGELLKARTVVPIHFGATGDPTYVEEPRALERFSSAARRAKLPVLLLSPGQGLTL